MAHQFSTTRGALIVLFLATAPTVAMAYIDPGNGAYMVQALFTLIGAALFCIRHPIRTAKLIWNRMMRRENAGSDSQDANPDGSASLDRAAESAAVPQTLGEAATIGGSADRER
jgi:hypothetical protein